MLQIIKELLIVFLAYTIGAGLAFLILIAGFMERSFGFMLLVLAIATGCVLAYFISGWLFGLLISLGAA